MASIVGKFFTSTFGTKPEVIARAPGRVEVLGNHTDYNEGYVLSFAIEEDVQVAIAESDSGAIELASTQFAKKEIVREIKPQDGHSWVNFPLGVYHVLKSEGLPVRPFKAAVHGTVPLGAGLSSSAAIEVATGLALCKLFNINVEPKTMAKYCQKAENEFVGAKCGLLDQFSSIFGKKDHVLFIDFRTLDHDITAIPDKDICVAITTSGVSHSLVESEYNKRRHECSEAAAFFSRKNASVKTLRDISMKVLEAASGELDPLYMKRARHIVGEDERVLEGIALLRKGEMKKFGELLYKSHESSRVNFENSCPELDILVEIASGIDGVLGSRLTGGGFGGATLTLLHKGARERFEKMMIDRYKKQTGKTAAVYFTTVADGAGIVK
jgi:galactokinase